MYIRTDSREVSKTDDAYMSGPFMLHASDPGAILYDSSRSGNSLTPIDLDQLRARREQLKAHTTRIMAARLRAMDEFVHAQWFV